MADTYTKIADLIDPEVMGDMVSARIPKKLRVAPFAKVDDTLAGVPGDTITVPAYAYIGDADIVAEGEAVTIEKMTTSTRKATVKKAMKGIGLTDEAVLSGYGNPVGEANTQLAMAIAAKIDNDCMDVLQTATLTYDGSAGIISYAGVVDAVDALQEEQATEKVIFVHPKQVTQLRKDAEFTSTDKYPRQCADVRRDRLHCGLPCGAQQKGAAGGGWLRQNQVLCLPYHQAGSRPRQRGRGARSDHLPQARGECGNRAQTQDPHHRDHSGRILRCRAFQRGQGGAGKVQGLRCI